MENTYQDASWLRQKIEVEGLTLKKIADMFDVSYPTIGYFAKKYGITRVGNTKTPENMASALRCQDIDWLKEQYITKNKSYDEISQEFGIGKTTIARWVKRHGLEKEDPPALRRKGYHPNVSTTCEYCGAAHKQKYSKVSKGFGRFCSQSCCSKSALEGGLLDKLQAGSRKFFSTEEGRLVRIESGIKSTLMQGGNSSSIERKVEGFLNLSGISFEKQKRMYYWVVDFYIPSADLVIEVMGDYWHFNPRVFNEPNTMQRKNIRRDKGKRAYLDKCDHNYLELWEFDINNNFPACQREILAAIEKASA